MQKNGMDENGIENVKVGPTVNERHSLSHLLQKWKNQQRAALTIYRISVLHIRKKKYNYLLLWCS